MIPLTIEIIKKSVKKVEMIKKSRNSKRCLKILLISFVANPLAGFYMRTTLTLNGLIKCLMTEIY